jgi:hypothetical protein
MRASCRPHCPQANLRPTHDTRIGRIHLAYCSLLPNAAELPAR